MYHYTVNKIGTGTATDPFRPDIPEGTPFVGNIGSDGEYLIFTTVEMFETTKRKKQLPRQALENACNNKGFTYDDVVNKWFVGGN
jgi:hypothetical protein